YKLLYVTDEEYPTQWTKIGYIREDTNRKVYYSPLSSTFIEPAMVYDFYAEQNDTLVITSFLQYYPTEVEIVITEVDSILIIDEYRKRIKFSCEYFDNNFWIEGVGSNNGLLETGFYCYIVCPEIELLCVQDQGEIIYQHEYYEECYYVGVEDNIANQRKFEIYPNPTKNDIHIIPLTNVGSDLVFILYNLKSEILIQREIINFNPSVINITNLKDGLYLYRIIDNSDLVQNGKIIIKK
ncbi:MAG: T9SS type A sorting domain-containing protein, partial [Bacteroidales bacterium]|nr:T9SS type A sorting domain-containing protein [Bacteroidales bacterium]